MGVRHEVITDPARLSRLHPAWESLLERASSNDPTNAPFWQETWWETFGALDGRKLRNIAFFEGERLVGLAPLLSRWHWYKPGIPLRRLELVASGEPAAHEICSEYNGVIVERGLERSIAQAFVQALRDPQMGDWDELELPLLPGDVPMVEALRAALCEAGHPAAVAIESTAPYIPLPRSWDCYISQLSSQSRYLINRSLRDLETWAGGELIYTRAETRDELANGSFILRNLHSERWSGADEKGGAFSSSLFRSFHEQASLQLLERGALELSWLSVRGEPIAALYNFAWNNKIYHYQSGRRLDLPRSVRAGIAIHAFAIRRAIERGLREYDFLGGEARYKQQLSLAERPLLCLSATRKPVVALAQKVARRGLNGARAVHRRLREMWKPSGTVSDVR
ncbi:MAG: GNAT family N-acetyltransferase [Polyangiaceae bacterium]|nr:GNAT family N-acetyltransferase [Polyangiaceae bacterium]